MPPVPELDRDQWIILATLHKHGVTARTTFREESLAPMIKVHFIRELHPNKLMITDRGSDHLIAQCPPDIKPLAGIEVKRPSAPPTPPTPPTPTTPPTPEGHDARKRNRFNPSSANGELRPRTASALRAIADAGGTVRASSLQARIAQKLLTEQFIEVEGDDTATITESGKRWLKQHPKTTESEPTVPPPPAPVNVAITTATPRHNHPLVVEAVAGHDGSALCSDPNCRASQILQLLMARSPAVRDAYSHFVGLDNSLERLSGV